MSRTVRCLLHTALLLITATLLVSCAQFFLATLGILIFPGLSCNVQMSRWQPVVDALHHYQDENGSLPDTLEALSPTYIAAYRIPPEFLPKSSGLNSYYHYSNEFGIRFSAGGWKDFIHYSSEKRGWYYLDDSGDPAKLISRRASYHSPISMVAYALLASCLIFGGKMLRSSVDVSKRRRLFGLLATLTGVVVILLGVHVPVDTAFFWLW